jgi:hypothetical protein
MTEIRKRAFVGIVGLVSAGLFSMGCSSSSTTPGTGGTTGHAGTSGGTAGTTGSGGATGSAGSTGTGGAVAGCAASDVPASTNIANFTSADGGVQAMDGIFTYGDTPKPTYSIAGNQVNIMDTVQIGASAHFQGFGLYFNGNAAGTDCVDGHAYTGIQFDLSGTLIGVGCTMQFSILDSEHADPTTSTPVDPKAGGIKGDYAPQLAISSLTSNATTIKVPYSTPAGGMPSAAVDPTKLTGVQWQLSVPVATDGGATECDWNINITNVKFYN